MKHIKRFVENLDIESHVNLLSDLFVEIADKYRLSDIEYNNSIGRYLPTYPIQLGNDTLSDCGVWGLCATKGWSSMMRFVIMINMDNEDIEKLKFEMDLGEYLEKITNKGYNVSVVSVRIFKGNGHGTYRNNKFYEYSIDTN